jgi:hypothetical protein
MQGAAFLAHMNTGGVIAQIPNTSQYVVAGTLAMIAKVLPAEQSSTAGAARQGGNTSIEGPTAYQSINGEKCYRAVDVERLFASVPPLTAPAPLTDDLRTFLLNHIQSHSAFDGQKLERMTLAHNDVFILRELLAKAAPAAPVQAYLAAELDPAEPVYRVSDVAAPVQTAEQAHLVGLKVEEIQENYYRIGFGGVWATAYEGHGDLGNKLLAKIAKAYLAAPVQEVPEQAPTDDEVWAAYVAVERTIRWHGKDAAIKAGQDAIRALIAPSTGEARDQGGARA